MLIWMNGRLREAEEAISAEDRGLTLGDGIYETLRVRAGRLRWAGRHWRRLTMGAAALRIPLPYPEAALERAATALLAARDLREGALRLTLTRGPAPRGLPPPAEARPTLILAAHPWSPPSARPLRLHVCRATRRNERSPLSRIKSLNAGDGLLARIEAAEHGADEALLLNTAGHVAEASVGNVVIRRAGRLLTPPVADGALPGIAREVLIERGMTEKRLSVEDLLTAESVWLCNSLGVRKVGWLDGAALTPSPRPPNMPVFSTPAPETPPCPP